VGRGHDELAQFAAVFNAMVQHIRVQMQRIRAESIAREAVESELRIAREIQADLVPRTFPPFPEHAEFDLHAIIAPARQVAGDFYDFFFSGADCLTLVIADVSGKGMPAALLMAVTRTIIRNYAGEGLSPVEIVRRANRMLVEDSNASMFVTMFLAQYQPSTGTLTYVNAGHPSPLSLLPGGTCRDYGDSTAPLVGVACDWPGTEFAQATRQLRVGESLVLFTDGVTEARDSEDRFFGEEGLYRTLGGHGGASAETLCQRVAAAVALHESGGQADDITVMVLQRKS
jgi:sigma-B regulation protein RsbU (phosphoserine phosphatase)